MEGGRPSPSSPSNQTLHHLQQINKHLGTLAMTTPTLTTPTEQLSMQEKLKERKAHRLNSDPGTEHDKGNLWFVRTGQRLNFTDHKLQIAQLHLKTNGR